MNARFTFVFAGLIGLVFAAAAAAEPLPTGASASNLTRDVSKLRLASANALVFDANTGQPIYAKGADTITPIASVTKLMTAMVVLDADQGLDETISVGIADLDLLKGSHSRLRLGSELSQGHHDEIKVSIREAVEIAVEPVPWKWTGLLRGGCAACSRE